MQIKINLKNEVATNFANYHGWTEDSGITVEDFVTCKLLDRVSNDTLELANRTALETVVPVADVTTNAKQTALKEQIATARQVKEAPVEIPVKVGK